MRRQENDRVKYCLPYCISHLASLAFAMAPNEEPNTSETKVSSPSHPSPNETPARDSQQVRTSPPPVKTISRLISVSALAI